MCVARQACLLLFWVLTGWAVAQTNLPVASPMMRSLPPVPPPMPPPAKSPLGFFRELLSQTPPERAAMLAGKSEVQRQQLEAKIKEYSALAPEEREVRLRVLELRWHLLPLMRLPPADRTAALADLEAEIRQLVESRLQQWDLLPPDLQKEVLENESMNSYFTRLDRQSPAEQQRAITSLPPGKRAQWEEQLARWRSVPPEQREKVFSRFNRFLELTESEKSKALNTLTKQERTKTEAALQILEKLPVAQRHRYLQGVWNFSNLTPAQRAAFLQNAERWQAMPPEERQAWRQLNSNLPPLPPGMNEPPLPPEFKENASAVPLPPGPIQQTN